MRILRILTLFVGIALAHAQDSVDVTFRYTPPQGAGTPYVPGEFNGWNATAWPMNYIGGPWIRNARLRVGGQIGGGVSGAYQYKFYYSGVTVWPNDPLNHHVNTSDNNNSFVIIKDPTFYHLLPNQRNPLVPTSTPTISCYIFPKVGTTVDTSSITLVIDGVSYTGLGPSYNFLTKQFVHTLSSPLPNGTHTLILRTSTLAGGTNADTVTFITQAGFVQITTHAGYVTRNPVRLLRGVVQDSTVSTVRLVHNNTDTLYIPVSNGTFADTVSLVEGQNVFRALADSNGTTVASDSVVFTYFVNHAPSARITYLDGGSTIQLQATASTDPDSGQAATLTFLWSEDPSNPAPIGGINGSTQATITITRPSVLGEYYFGLIATDADGNKDTTRNYFILNPTPPIITPHLASVPSWVRQGRMYEMFFKSHTPQGTITAAYPDLDRIAAMGYNIVWVMPVMRNRDPIDNNYGPGYNIVDFYTVAPEYGTNQDFKNFVNRAHQLGMKVILDVTPNHSSNAHPFVLDGKIFRLDSRYWDYYQHRLIPYNGVFLGQFGSPPNHDQQFTPDGYVYYGPFSDALLNYNWSDIDARHYMLEVYKYWINEMGIDGYRFDVYWGPHIRTNSPNGGESDMGRPVRETLKDIKPDIHLLAEAAGVGIGTERLYADNGDFRGPGGAESAYDWLLKDIIQDQNTRFWNRTPSDRVNTLDARLRNGSSNSGMGFLPGPNSYFLRFMENHDEDRTIHVFGFGVDSITAMQRTMPVSTAIMLAVGMPLVYSGQEVGWGYGIPGNKEARARSVINWNTFARPVLMPHYQKLAQIRKQFICFTTQQMVRVSTNNSAVYAYTRPYAGMNGVVVTNLQGVPASVAVTLTTSSTPPGVEGITNGVPYTVTDVYNNNVLDTIMFSGGTATLTADLAAYGSSVFVIADSAHTLVLPPLVGVDGQPPPTLPEHFSLAQNFPNPFNPSTVIRYSLPVRSSVSLKVYDILGREIATLVEEQQPAGRYETTWDASGFASGVYLYRLTTDHSTLVKKMLMLR